MCAINFVDLGAVAPAVVAVSSLSVFGAEFEEEGALRIINGQVYMPVDFFDQLRRKQLVEVSVLFNLLQEYNNLKFCTPCVGRQV